jgi:hypothetical protein
MVAEDRLESVGGSGKWLNDSSLAIEAESPLVMDGSVGVANFLVEVDSGEKRRKASMLLSNSLCLRRRSSIDVTLLPWGIDSRDIRRA